MFVDACSNDNVIFSENLTEYAISQNTFIWLISHLCRMNQIPFDQDLLLHQFVPPYTVTTIFSVLQELDFELLITCSENAIQYNHQLPAIVLLQQGYSKDELKEPDNGHKKEPEETVSTELGILLRSDGERLLWIDSSSEMIHTAHICNPTGFSTVPF